MSKTTFALAPLLLWGPVFGAQSCDELRAQIDAKLHGAGVPSYSLTVVDAGAAAAGKVVGRCELGAKKIVYAVNGGATGAAPASQSAAASRPARSRPAGPAILTECKDGTVSMGGDCKK